MQGASYILLDKCSGASWWCDDSYDYGEGKVRAPAWRIITREK